MSLEKFCATSDPNHLINLNDIDLAFLISSANKAIARYPDPENEYHQKAAMIIAFLGSTRPPRKCSMGLLSNIGASCYLDSVLFALFASKSTFIRQKLLVDVPRVSKSLAKGCTKESLLEIQRSLRAIYSSIHGGPHVKYCTNLRKSFRKCSKGHDSYASTGTRDSGDFLAFLFNLFDMDVATKRLRTYGTDSRATIPKDKVMTEDRVVNASVIIDVATYILKSYKETPITTFLKIAEDSGYDSKGFKLNDVKYKRMIITKELKSAPYLVFNLVRGIEGSFIGTKVIPSPTITIHDGTEFELVAIVVYQYYHYMAYVKCGEYWFHYDDVGPRFKQIGSFNDLLNAKPKVATNGTLFFYDRV